MSDQPAPQLDVKYDATFAEKLKAAREQLSAAATAVDSLEQEYIAKVVLDLRPQRDDYRRQVGQLTRDLEAATRPSTPAKPPPTFGVFKAQKFDPASLPKEMRALYDSSIKDLKKQVDGPMQKARQGLPPYAEGDDPYFSANHWRWVGHTFLQALTHCKLFGETEQVERMAEVFLGITSTAPTGNGPKYTSKKLASVFDAAGKLIDDRELLGVRRFWRSKPGSDIDQSDWSGLEVAIEFGVVASHVVAFNDLRGVSKTMAAAADDSIKLLYEMKARMEVMTRVLSGKGREWWFWNTDIWHALVMMCAGLWVMWKGLGDESAKAGYEYYAKILQENLVYGKMASGKTLVNMPHQPAQRSLDLWGKKPTPGILGGAHDKTYPETENEGLWLLYWTGCPWVTADLLGAYGRTLLECDLANWTRGGDMAEAICGSHPSKSYDGQEVMLVRGGKEVVKTPGIRANRTRTRQANASGRRAGMLSLTVFTGDAAYLPELDNLSGQYGAYACDTWALAFLGHQAQFPILEQVKL